MHRDSGNKRTATFTYAQALLAMFEHVPECQQTGAT